MLSWQTPDVCIRRTALQSPRARAALSMSGLEQGCPSVPEWTWSVEPLLSPYYPLFGSCCVHLNMCAFYLRCRWASAPL